ncbi:MAG: heme-copper oxidase subunit III, partial [Elusimicrobia bacterium]|nr:heme-copper oxidase subunit III [Elusimicrobiota bacterium]
AAASWPLGWKVLNVPLGTLNTFILIASSVTIVLAHARAAARDKKGFMTFMGITVFLAFCFLVVKGFEWHHEFSEGIYPSSSIFYAVYFTTTGLHALHVICGIIWNTGLMWWASRDGFDDPLFVGRTEYAGLYWHFVDIVWIFLFPALYLM